MARAKDVRFGVCRGKFTAVNQTIPCLCGMYKIQSKCHWQNLLPSLESADLLSYSGYYDLLAPSVDCFRGSSAIVHASYAWHKSQCAVVGTLSNVFDCIRDQQHQERYAVASHGTPVQLLLEGSIYAFENIDWMVMMPACRIKTRDYLVMCVGVKVTVDGAVQRKPLYTPQPRSSLSQLHHITTYLTAPTRALRTASISQRLELKGYYSN
jgi:hypothetical protein